MPSSTPSIPPITWCGRAGFEHLCHQQGQHLQTQRNREERRCFLRADDVRLIRSKLSERPIDIQEEAKRQQTEIAETIQELREGLDRVRPALADHARTNAGHAGTPIQSQGCRAALMPNRQSPKPRAPTNAVSFVAVMVPDRLRILNAWFGREEAMRFRPPVRKW
jgi:hypothetical protein